MDSRRFELEQDLEDIDRLLNSASRDNSKQVLIKERLRLASELQSLPKASAPVVETSEKNWKPIDKFAWEQTDDDVKIYVTCFEGFKSHPKEGLVVESDQNSVTVSVVSWQGVNYRLRFPKLCKDIKGARTTAKSNGFSLTLKKKERGHWDSIVPKKSVLPKEEEESKDDKDAGDSLMKMMKNLYEEGDDDMKRTIAEAWSKSKDKP